MESRQVRLSAPGIGEAGKITHSNHGTRAILVCNDLATPQSLQEGMEQLSGLPTTINRRVLKAISPHSFLIGDPLCEGSMSVEACIPFSGPQNEQLYWLVAGNNTGNRLPDQNQIDRYRHRVAAIKQNARYDPQTGSQLLEWVRAQGVDDMRLARITLSNFTHFRPALDHVYREAFTVNGRFCYPYDPVPVIGETCDTNIYVAAVANSTEQILSITGAEMMQVAEIPIAEIGDSASAKGVQGLGAIVKRYLFELMCQGDNIPALSFTDSRIAHNEAVLKANRRAGFEVDGSILPFHTEIASDRDPAHTIELTGTDGATFLTEHMTMTYASRARVAQVVQQFGGIPL